MSAMSPFTPKLDASCMFEEETSHELVVNILCFESLPKCVCMKLIDLLFLPYLQYICGLGSGMLKSLLYVI